MSEKGKMGKSAEFKKHFEEILGRDLEADIDGGVVLRERVGTYTYYTYDEGRATSRDIGATGAETKGCGNTLILDVSGVSRTGTDGKVEFLLSDFHCINDIRIKYPINFLATPRSLAPTFLTTARTLTQDWTDVKITVSSWDPTGTPAGNSPFDWRCRIPYAPIID